MMVKVVQVHTATVVQTTSYELPDDKAREFEALLPPYREQFLWNNATEGEDETDITEIHETKDVEVTW